MPDRHLRRGPGAALLITAAAVVLAHALVLSHGFHLVHDAAGYAALGRGISETGLLGLSREDVLPPGRGILLHLRTYAYPLFLAACSLFSRSDPRTLQVIVFEVQLATFLAGCWYGAACFRQFAPRPRFAATLHAVTALNPWLLIRTGEVLTDSLSLTVGYLALLLTLRLALRPAADPAPPWTRLALPFFLAGLGVMIRPSGLTLAPALGVLWLIAPASGWLARLRALPVIAAAFALPFVPQLVNNYHLSGRIRPLTVGDVYQETRVAGMRTIKRATFDSPHSILLEHHNPLLPPAVDDPDTFRRRKPVRFAATCALHLFAFFDQDNPYTYIRRPRSWYRWPSSVASFLFLGLCALGVALTVRDGWRPRPGRGHPLLYAGLLLSVALTLALYLPAHVEARYAAGIFLPLSPFLVVALLRLRLLIRRRRYPALAAVTAGLGLLLLTCVALSAWLDTFRSILPA